MRDDAAPADVVGLRDDAGAEGYAGPVGGLRYDVAADGLSAGRTVRLYAAGCEPVRIVAMTAAHAGQVLAIYQAGIDEGNATFETAAPAWPEFSAARLSGHRYVAIDRAAGQVIGWVAISATSSRPAYAGVVEHSVYVHPAARGRGVGRLLLGALIKSTESAGIWTIQSGIFPENAASIALHRSAGFKIVGTRERIARHRGRWRDILLMERRSLLI